MKIPTPTVSLLFSTLLLTGCASVDKNTANQSWYKTWERQAYTAHNMQPPSQKTSVPPENILLSGDTSSWAARQHKVAVENVQIGIIEQDYIGRYYGI